MAGTVDGVLRTACRPRWLLRHVLALVLIAALILLGRWQWDVSNSPRGSLQNLLYAFQWWAMAMMVGYGWWRLLRDDAYGRPSVPVTTARAVLMADDASWESLALDPTSVRNFQAGGAAPTAQEREADPELADYNDYLSRLNARAERAR
jgi:DNA-binding transcriptional regulator of glucitol operon